MRKELKQVATVRGLGPLAGRHRVECVCRMACLLWVLGFQMAWSEPDHQRVLLLHASSRDYLSQSSVAHVFRSELTRNNPQKIEFIDISLQVLQLGDEHQAEILAKFIAASFADKPPDLIAAIGGPAAQFYLHMVSDYFPATPLLLAGGTLAGTAGRASPALLFTQDEFRRLREFGKEALVVRVNFELDLLISLADIRRLLPGLTRIHFLTGTTSAEKKLEKLALAEWGSAGVTVQTHSHLAFDEMVEAVRRIPPNEAVFLGVLDRDAAGVPFDLDAAIRQFHAVSRGPIFGMASYQIGSGIVGGRLFDMELAGKRAAEAAVLLLAGTPPLDIRVESVRLGNPVYDWREIQRWKIPEQRLPPGSELQFRPPSIWESHRETMLLGSGIISIQTCLILLLVSARRRAREMHDHLELAAEAAGAGFSSMDLSQGAVRPAGQWCRLFGFSGYEDRVSLDETFARVPAVDRGALRATIESAARNKTGYSIEHRVILPDGQERWIASFGRASESPRERLKIRGVSIDITARKRDELEIEQQRRALLHLSRVDSLGFISGSLVHELNQPLATILSNAQAAQIMLSRPGPDLDEIGSILSDIVDDDRRASRVIQSWRALLRRGKVTSIPIQLTCCIEEVIKLTRLELGASAVSLQTSGADETPMVLIDLVQLQQVFLNLILNARDAMLDVPPDRRRIEIRSWQEGGMARVAVRDWGMGLPEGHAGLFEPFRTTKEDGLGMGLAISHTIITHHGGCLWAVTPEGFGAEFHLSLPIHSTAL